MAVAKSHGKAPSG